MILLLLSVAQLADAWWENSKVLTLTSSTFESLVGNDKHVVVEYFTPWCHWCRRMFDDYEAVWEHYNGPQGAGSSTNVLIARINADDHTETVSRQGINAYPSIVYYKPGHGRPFSHFHGDRTAAKFIAWIDALIASPEPVEAKQGAKDPHGAHGAHEIEEEDLEEVEESLEEEEELISYEFIMTDLTKALDDRWRGDFNHLQITLDDLRDALLNEMADLRVTQADTHTYSKQQAVLAGNRFLSLEDRLEQLNYEVSTRNRVEASQSHINISHMTAFLTVGFVLGCAVAAIASKTQRTREVKRSKV